MFLLIGINAKYIHSNPAVYSLENYARKQGFEEIKVVEYTINNDFAYILEEIYKNKPTVIGLSCYIWNISIVERLLVEIPKVLPTVDIWLGGPEASYRSFQLMEQYPSVKGVMCGEGEKIFCSVLENYMGENIFSKIHYLDDGSKNATEVEIMSQREAVSSMLPYIVVRSDKTNRGYEASSDTSDSNGEKELLEDYLCLAQKDGYLNGNEIPFFHENISFENRIIYYESQRGCPFNCTYCLSSVEKSLRFKDVDMVKRELQFFLDKNVTQVKFVDRTFNCNKKRTMEILEFICDNDNGITNFHFEVAADILDDEEILLIGRLRPGQVQLEIGVQTTKTETLEEIKRPCDIKRLKDNVLRLRSIGNVHIHLDLIAGLPFENIHDFKKSFDEVYNMKPHQLQLGFLKVLSGTEIAKRVSEYGICSGSIAPYEVLYTKWLSYEDVNLLKRIEEMVEIYYNSAQFVNAINLFENAFGSPFELYRSLAAYYSYMNYYVVLPKRFRKYEILLEFAEFTNKINEDNLKRIDVEKLREALTLDYYLREKPKSKPDFVNELPKYKIDYSRKDPISGNYILTNV